MGVTIHYRGSMDDLTRVEDFEDRVIDLALAVGGNVRLWRTADAQRPERVIRGLILDLAPGQETMSLLLSPEGWLTSVFEIEDAELGKIAEPSWCFVKTQYGPIEGHVAIVELLTQLKSQFMSNLEVLDDSGYWEHRNLDKLQQNFARVAGLIDALAKAIENDRLSPEAAEDPEILATRIERLAAKVHRTMSRPAEHAPVTFPEDMFGASPDQREEEARWDALYQENRRKQERMERAIEERLIRGDDLEEALESAFEEVIPPNPLKDDDAGESDFEELLALEDDRLEEAEDSAFSADADDSALDMERHPLQQQATALLLDFHNLARGHNGANKHFDQLLRNACEIGGGLAQALPLPPPYELDEFDAGLALLQLKRAMRGAAFVTGALHLLVADDVIDRSQFKVFVDRSEAIATEIVDLMRTIREARA